MSITFQQKMFENIRLNLHYGVILSFLFAILTSFGARIYLSLPFSPIPITGQTLFVLLSGTLLGKKYGSLSQVIYILFGGFGLLKFAGGKTGFDVLYGPSVGYLFGFVLGAYITGWLTEIHENRTGMNLLFPGVIGNLLIYIMGVFGLMIFIPIDFQTAISVGMLPFIPGDIFKIILVFLLSRFFLPSQKTQIDLNNSNFLTILLILIAIIVIVSYLFFLFSANGAIPKMILPITLISCGILTSIGIIISNKQ